MNDRPKDERGVPPMSVVADALTALRAQFEARSREVIEGDDICRRLQAAIAALDDREPEPAPVPVRAAVKPSAPVRRQTAPRRTPEAKATPAPATGPGPRPARVGSTHTRDTVLEQLRRGGAQSGGAIARVTKITQPTVSKILRSLVDEGLVVRRGGGVKVAFALKGTAPVTPSKPAVPAKEAVRGRTRAGASTGA